MLANNFTIAVAEGRLALGTHRCCCRRMARIRKNGHDLVTGRLHDDDLLLYKHKVVAAKLRDNFDDLGRQWLKAHVPRHGGADRQRKVDAVEGLDVEMRD